MSDEKRGPGRPGRPRSPGERVPTSVRLSTDIKAKLLKAALDSGRSQSQEAELRIEQSFKTKDYLLDALDLAYGPEFTALLLTLATAMQLTGTRAIFASGETVEGFEKWMTDPYAFAQAAEAASVILEAFRPGDKASAAGPVNNLGEGMAALALTAIRSPRHHLGKEDWAKQIRGRLKKGGVRLRRESGKGAK